MQSIEVTGKSLDEAKAAAATKLGVAVDALTVTVLEETKGLFGKSTVRIKAAVIEAAPAKAAKPAAKPARAPKAAPAPVAKPEPEPVVETVVEAAAPAAEKPGRKPRAAKPAKVEAAPVAAAAPSEDRPAREEAVATQKDADWLLAMVQDLLDKSGLAVTAKGAGTQGRYVNICFDGKDAGYLVGKHGEVLNSFQYVSNIIAAQQLSNGVRLVLDGNDYRSRREEQLTTLAVKIAEQVVQRGEEAVLDALPAFERRIVHKALSEIDGISTYSEGEEPNRRVVIAPAE